LRARIHELECAKSETLRVTTTTTAQEIVDRLAAALPDVRLAQVWVRLGERLKAATPRGRTLGQYPYPATRPPQRQP